MSQPQSAPLSDIVVFVRDGGVVWVSEQVVFDALFERKSIAGQTQPSADPFTIKACDLQLLIDAQSIPTEDQLQVLVDDASPEDIEECAEYLDMNSDMYEDEVRDRAIFRKLAELALQHRNGQKKVRLVSSDQTQCICTFVDVAGSDPIRAREIVFN